MMRRFLLATAAVLAAVLFFLLVTLPPAPARTSGGIDANLVSRTIPGAYHVHTSRSDGAGDRESVARAAAKAGLRFVIFTDHGDGTRPLEAPVYRDGVLCIDAVEISTTEGHYVALDMPVAPYPLGGEASAVVEDVARLGGFGIAAHPDSSKPDLAWTDWAIPLDGIEWLSADTEWRNESRARLARVLFDYLVRPAGALATTLDRPVSALARWDALASRRPTVALGALDAHGGVRRRAEGGSRMMVAGLPSYEASFKSFSVRIVADEPLTGRAELDGPLLLRAIRRGRAFTAIDATAGPAYLDFHAGTPGADFAYMGGASRDNSVELSAAAAAADGSSIVLLRNGVEIAREAGSHLRTRASGPGAYRVEVHAPHEPGAPPVPWLTSNPIYVNLPPPPEPPITRTSKAIDLISCAWHVEKDPTSRAAVVAGAVEGVLTYELGSREAASQFVALACDLPEAVPAFEFVEFRARSRAPSRVSVQLRFAHDGERRWRRSVYADATARVEHIAVDDLVAAERDGFRRPDAARATAVLFVVDLTNARPGASGEFSIANLALTRPAGFPRGASR